MKHVEDSAKRFVRFGMYTVLAFISGTIGFLGFRHHDAITSTGGVLVETAYADAPPPPPTTPPTQVCYHEQGNSYCVGPSENLGTGGNGGYGGNGSDSGNDSNGAGDGDGDGGDGE